MEGKFLEVEFVSQKVCAFSILGAITRLFQIEVINLYS